MGRRLDKLLTEISDSEPPEPPASAVPTESAVPSKSAGRVKWRDLTAEQSSEQPTIAEQLPASRTDSTESLTASLVAVDRRQIRSLAYSHQLDTLLRDDSRCLTVRFEVENTGSRPVHWIGDRTRFIGTDGTTYRQVSFAVDPAKIDPAWLPKQALVAPETRATVLTPVEPLPSTVELESVVQTVVSSEPPSTQQLHFTVR